MHELDYLYLLKEKVVEAYRRTYPYWSESIHDFKGREIANLQELLENKAGARISEKWFYTHLKPKTNQKLPRLDTLNLLSFFVGFENWEQFIAAHSIPKTNEPAINPSSTPVKKNRKLWLIPAMAMLGLFVFVASQWIPIKKKYTICFVDTDQEKPIQGDDISLQLLNKNESPLEISVDEKGCATLKTKTAEIKLVVRANYFYSDTIVRKLSQKRTHEVIKLKTDDYALMIHLFSTSKIEDWEKRRNQLDQMIANDAVIFQIAGSENIGMEMYNKEEFIDKLTIPVNSLKDIEIIETNYQDGQIIEMRFSQNDN